MSNEYTELKTHQNYTWIKSASGNTYLCPVGAVSVGASDDELKAACVDESSNPQNN